MRTLLLVAVLSASLFATTVAAEPPEGSKCVGNYNPDALTNVCYKQNSGNPGTPPGTGHTGTVTTTNTEVCPIGNTCQDVPVPGYTSSGGVEYPYPGTPGTPGTVGNPYVEVLGYDAIVLAGEVVDALRPVIDCRTAPNPAANKVECILGALGIDPQVDPL